MTILTILGLSLLGLGLCIKNNWLAFPFSLNYGNYFQEFYVKPWTRASPYLWGFFIGIYYREYFNEKLLNANSNTLIEAKPSSPSTLSYQGACFFSKIEPILKRKILFRLDLYTFGLFLINFFIFIPRQIQFDHNAWTPAMHYFFNSFSKLLFVVGLT